MQAGFRSASCLYQCWRCQYSNNNLDVGDGVSCVKCNYRLKTTPAANHNTYQHIFNSSLTYFGTLRISFILLYFSYD